MNIGECRMRIGDVVIYKTKHLEKNKVDHMRDCEYCPFSWESRGYEGECYDCGCRMAKPPLNNPYVLPYVCVAKIWVCLLPCWVKRLIKRMRGWDE